MLMSARSALDASDIITPDGRIVLTPTRELSSRRLSDHDNDHVYEQVGTPLHDATRTTPLREHGRGFHISSKGMSEPLILGEDHVGGGSFHSHATSLNAQKGLSRRAVKVLHFASSTLVALSLLSAVLLRANVISALYLLILCYGVFQSFASGRLMVVTMTISTLACIGHIVFAAALDHQSRGWKGEHALKIIGFGHIRNVADGVIYPGIDALVLFCSLIHFFVVLRRLRLPDQDETFDLFEEAGAQLLRQDQGETRESRRSTKVIHGVEILSMLLLFLTAFIVPAGATAVLYVALLLLLVSWTVYAKRITVEAFVDGDPKKEYVIGRRVAQALLMWCFVIIVAW